jgi:hypothetical protein
MSYRVSRLLRAIKAKPKPKGVTIYQHIAPAPGVDYAEIAARAARIAYLGN